MYNNQEEDRPIQSCLLTFVQDIDIVIDRDNVE